MPSNHCQHPDIRSFDGIRCCLSCGFALHETPPSSASALSDIDLNTYQLGVSKYCYRRLNYELGKEIRLLVLYPGHFTDDLVCDIIHVNLLDNPVYEAVSYTWANRKGDASLSQTIRCPSHAVKVTRNCEAALRRSRRRGFKRTVWIDAVCIDQTNVEERNHQVGQMKTVYSQATQVLVYLCEQSEESDLIFDYLRECELTSVGEALMKYGPIQYLVGASLRVLSHPWFRRIWVVQEVALSKNAVVVAGDKVLNWSAFSFNNLSIKFLAMQTEVNRSLSLLKLLDQGVLHWMPGKLPSTDLLDVLQATRSSVSTDPRDKVYAVLGLVRPDIQESIIPDYFKTPAQLFLDVALVAMRSRGSLDFLSYATRNPHVSQPQQSDGILSSWIPDWTLETFHDLMRPQFTLTADWSLPTVTGPVPLDSKANNAIHQWLPYYEAGPQLKVRAQLLGIIGGVAVPRQLREVRDWSMGHFEIYVEDDQLLFDWKRYSFSLCRQCIDVIQESEHNDLQEIVICRYRYHDNSISYRNVYHHPSTHRSKSTGVLSRDRKRHHFVTGNSVGFSSSRMFQIGDEIWALEGARVPFILRKLADRPQYILIGECYLHGALLEHVICNLCGTNIRKANPIPMEEIKIY